MNRLVKLLKAISDDGLEEVAKEASPYAYETAKRIAETGKDLEPQFPEMQTIFDEDTALTAKVLSNPETWGISDPRWKEFCEKWRTR